jgi:glyoxylase-like metal-dependent hydrolase (beta-lactamase superfamily II)
MKIGVRTVGPFEENCYLVLDETTGAAVLVDPGDDGEELIEMVRQSGARLDAVWLTHAHLDHIGAINAVRRVHQVPVYLHPMDLPWYEGLSGRSAAMYGLSWDQPDIAPLPLADGATMPCGSLAFTVMHVPGHAPGHVSFNGNGVALSGDLLFAGSIGRTDLPLCDPYAMDASLERFAALAETTIVYPGHGPSTTLARELATNPFLTGAARSVKR